jgi:hypothetical protein
MERPKVNEIYLRPKPKKVGTREKFLIYSNSHCVDFREKTFRELSSLGQVEFGGRCTGGTGVEGNESNRVQAQDLIPIEQRASNFFQYAKYRYCLVMENKKFPGYISEKIILAFLGGCIPIYYGDAERTFDIFNNKSFLFYNVDEKDSASRLLKKVSESEANPDEYVRTCSTCTCLYM